MALTGKMDLKLLHQRIYRKIKLYDADTKSYITFILEHVLYDKIQKVYIKSPDKNPIYRNGKKQAFVNTRNSIINTTYADYLIESVKNGFNDDIFADALKCVFSEADIRELKIKYLTKHVL
jgi:hypothetical protein